MRPRGAKMGFLSQLFGSKRPTRGELIRDLVTLFVEEYTKPTKFFAGLDLAEGQTRDGALAEWYAVKIAAWTYGLMASVNAKERIVPILEAFPPVFLKSLSPGCREVFVKIAAAREQEYVEGISAALHGEHKGTKEALALSCLMARRITGQQYDDLATAL